MLVEGFIATIAPLSVSGSCALVSTYLRLKLFSGKLQTMLVRFHLHHHVRSTALTLALTTVLSPWTMQGRLPVYPPEAQAASAQSRLTSRRVVVLPFRNLTRQERDDWLSESFSEGLMTGLGQLRSLRLIERAEMHKLIQEQAFMQSALADPAKAPQLGQMVGAEYMVLGNFQKINNELLINARLVNVSTGLVEPGSQTQVRGRFQDLFDLQADLTQHLIQQLRVQQSPDEQAQVRQNFQQTRSTASHKVYIKAQKALEFALIPPAQLRALVSQVEAALKLDPDYRQLQLSLARLLLVRARNADLYANSSKAEDMQRAERLIQALLQTPESESLLALSKLRALQERPAEAVAAARQAVEMKPTSPTALNYLEQKYDIEELFYREDGLKIVEQDLQSLGVDVNEPLLLGTLGYAYFPQLMARPQGNHQAFIQRLNQAFERHPMPTISLQLAMIHLMKNERPEYERYIEKTLDLGRQNPMVLFLVALSVQFVEPNKALALSHEIERLQPDFIYASFLKSGIYQRQLKNPHKALELMQNLLRKHPQSSRVAYQAALLYAEQERDTEALKAFQRALSLGLEPAFQNQLLSTRAEVHTRMKNYPAAFADYAQILQSYRFNPRLDQTLKKRAQLLAELQRYDEAIADMKSFLQDNIRRNAADERLYKLWVLQRQNQQTPDNPKILNDLGQLYLQEKSYAQAEQYLQRALKLNAQNPTPYFNLALVYQAQGRYESASPLLQTALRLRPDYLKAWSAQAKNQLQLNELQTAEQSARQALSLKADAAEAWEVLAQILTRLGQTEQAERAWRAVLQINPKHSGALKALGRETELEAEIKLRSYEY